MSFCGRDVTPHYIEREDENGHIDMPIDQNPCPTICKIAIDGADVLSYNAFVSECIRVWRSLVARLNGVQEAAGSTPVTRTKCKR